VGDKAARHRPNADRALTLTNDDLRQGNPTSFRYGLVERSIDITSGVK
jgi:hypothetical protein